MNASWSDRLVQYPVPFFFFFFSVVSAAGPDSMLLQCVYHQDGLNDGLQDVVSQIVTSQTCCNAWFSSWRVQARSQDLSRFRPKKYLAVTIDFSSTVLYCICIHGGRELFRCFDHLFPYHYCTVFPSNNR